MNTTVLVNGWNEIMRSAVVATPAHATVIAVPRQPPQSRCSKCDMYVKGMLVWLQR